MHAIILLIMSSLFAFTASANSRSELNKSKQNAEKCKKEFSKYLQEEWAVEVEKLIEKNKKKGLNSKAALEKAEKEATSWTKQLKRINDGAEKLCKSQNWAVGCRVSFGTSTQSGAKCTLTPVDSKSRDSNGREKSYPGDFI